MRSVRACPVSLPSSYAKQQGLHSERGVERGKKDPFPKNIDFDPAPKQLVRAGGFFLGLDCLCSVVFFVNAKNGKQTQENV